MTQPHPQLTPELQRKADILRCSRFFAGIGGSLVQKQLTFLVLAGLKPGSVALSCHEVRTAHRTKLVPDDPHDVADLLDSLALAYRLDPAHHLSPGDVCTAAYVSLDASLRDKLYQAERSGNEYEAGLLLGFPKTAVDAWRDDRLLPHDEETRLYSEAGVRGRPDFFRLSEEHTMNELAVLRSWWRVLQQYGLL